MSSKLKFRKGQVWEDGYGELWKVIEIEEVSGLLAQEYPIGDRRRRYTLRGHYYDGLVGARDLVTYCRQTGWRKYVQKREPRIPVIQLFWTWKNSSKPFRMFRFRRIIPGKMCLWTLGPINVTIHSREFYQSLETRKK